MAYAIGLLVTDGNLSPDGRHICFVSRDLEQLQTIARILELTNAITKHTGGYSQDSQVFRLSFGDRLLYDWLVSLGITPRKTFTIGPVEVPDPVFQDFLRGHLDGDGSIIAYVDRHNTRLNPKYVYQRLYVRFLSASQPHIEWLRLKVRRLLGVDGYIMIRPPRARRQPLFALNFSKKAAITLLRWIYYSPEVPCLSRKRAVAAPFLSGDIRDFRHPKGLRS